ncbi:MAG: hydroxyacid dehydrogenase [Firmicutes bacterium]|nr:hydroxyacid dehydrogenase [Bacillota bacterium]
MDRLSADILDKLPRPDEAELDRLLAAEIAADDHKIVVLDDDPTGVQTVHDISVFTGWDEDSVREGFLEENKLFYILTKSRGMTPEETAAVHREISETVAKVASELGRRYLFMSRSDSTLRGHYPLEPELLREGMEARGVRVDGEVLTPFFKEGGRFTIGNVHYVQQGNELVPAADTEFAKDKSFGYTKSSIPEYIEEKTRGEYKAEGVTCVSLEELRGLRLDDIEAKLLAVKGFGKVCVNAADYCDIKAFSIALYRAMRKGKSFMFRTAAGLVKVMGGVSDRPLLSGDEMTGSANGRGGIVVVGSHMQKTTDQLNELLKLDCAVPVEFDSDKVLEGDEALDAEVRRCVKLEEEIMSSGRIAAVYTRRKLLTVKGDTKESALIRSVKISDAVQRLVGELGEAPSFIIAKGGITSSDIGKKALKVRRADVMGQIRPGIPVWRTGAESRFPGIPYVIFPGNTGSVTDLRTAAEILQGAAHS